MNEFAVFGILVLSVIGIVLFAGTFLRSRGKKKQIRTKPTSEVKEEVVASHAPIRVKKITLYPIKSCKGVDVHSARTSETGFEDDRQYMFITSHGRFMSQRALPKMALIAPTLHPDGGVVLRAPGMDTLHVPLTKRGPDASLHTVSIFRDEIHDAIDQGDAAGKWIDAFLGTEGGRLVHMGNGCVRELSSTFAADLKGTHVSFADGYPYLFASEASLGAVRDAAEGEDIKMNRFRPNVVVEGCEAFQEDTWRTFNVGDGAHTFYGRKRCVRCKMPTTNQETGEQAGIKAAPYTTLQAINSTSKRMPLFGINAIYEWKGTPATVTVGDDIKVLKITREQGPQ